VSVYERGQPGGICFRDLASLGVQRGPCGVDVLRVPDNDGVDDQSECPELVFLVVAVALAYLSAAAVEDRATSRWRDS
jgi:hypothetical protein